VQMSDTMEDAVKIELGQGPKPPHLPKGQKRCNEDIGEACTYTGARGDWLTTDESFPHNVMYPASKSWQDPKTDIFLTIASFRDKLCSVTLYNIFSKAEFPNRLRVAVVQQNDPEVDVDCFYGYCELYREHHPEVKPHECPYSDQIFMERIHHREAKGPVFARSIGSDMIPDDAEFCMQIDSHMDFLPGFDTAMMNMWGATNNEYAVLSTYVSDLSVYEEEAGGLGVNQRHEVPHLCMIRFHGGGQMPRNWGTKCLVRATKPKLTNALWGAGLSFSKCHAERKTPNDPNLPYVFDGEEFSKAARLWTYGYDIYTPHRVYVFHDYKKSQGDPNHMRWASNNPAIPILEKDDKLMHKHHVMVKTEAQAWMRLRALINMPNDYDNLQLDHLRRSRFGLGDRRTLNQLIIFSGLNTTSMHEQIDPYKCANLEIVPFKEHVAGADYIPHYDEWDRPIDPYDPGSIYYGIDMNDPRTQAKPGVEFQYRVHTPGKTFVKSNEKPLGALSSGMHGPGGPGSVLAGYYDELPDNEKPYVPFVSFMLVVVIVALYKRFSSSKIPGKGN